jgi:N-acetylglutamate synthase-like GNAT family acetyltransferase
MRRWDVATFVRAKSRSTRLSCIVWENVAPRFRRRGIGEQLCRVVESRAAELGIPKLYLFTRGQEPLYAKLGWTYMEPTMWHGRRCGIMWKVPSAV